MVNRLNNSFKVVLLGFLFLFSYLNASQKETDIFAKYVANNVFDLDKDSLIKTAKIHLNNNKKIRAFQIFENNHLFLSSYKKNERLILRDRLPSDISMLNKYSSDIYFEGIYLGEINVYYDENYALEFKLSQKEKEYLQNKKVITMCVDPNWMPYESIINHKYIGIGSEYINLFAKKLKTEFKLIETKSWEESKQNAKERVCDILPLSSYSQSRQEFMNITSAHLVEALVLTTKMNVNFITNLNELKGKKIGITSGYSIVDTFKDNYPGIEIVETKDIISGLSLVEEGELFGQIDAISSMNYYIQMHFQDRLKISSKFNETYELGVASNKDEPILHDILKKLINSISDKEYNQIYYKWNSERIVIEKIDLKVLFQIFFVGLVIVLAFLYWNRKLKKEVDQRTKELKQINENLEERIRTEVEKNRQNELTILEQSKLASLGDMIGNIAHQWRQPLSMISLASTGTLFQYKTNTLNDKELEDQMNIINDNAQYLSSTIDTFRSFLKDSKEVIEINIHENVDNALNIVSSMLQNHSIKLIKNLNTQLNLKKKMPMGELSEVIINIVNNSNDALVENKVNEPWVKVNIDKTDNKILISIEDNAGGIPSDILSKVFEPYFTTKHQSKGTGLGLHMSYRIIVESLNGKINVENTVFGAKFTVELPMDINS